MAPLNAVTAIIPAAIMALAALYGVLRGVDVFSAMADGAREGLRVVVSIFPPLVGLLTAGCCAWLGKKRLSAALTVLPVTLIPSLGVASWLSYLLGLSYWVTALSLLVGQFISGIAGALLSSALKKIWKFQ